MLNAATPGLTVSSAAILMELLKEMDEAARLELLERAAVTLETSRSRSTSVLDAVKLLRGDWTKIA